MIAGRMTMPSAAIMAYINQIVATEPRPPEVLKVWLLNLVAMVRDEDEDLQANAEPDPAANNLAVQTEKLLKRP